MKKLAYPCPEDPVDIAAPLQPLGVVMKIKEVNRKILELCKSCAFHFLME